MNSVNLLVASFYVSLSEDQVRDLTAGILVIEDPSHPNWEN